MNGVVHIEPAKVQSLRSPDLNGSQLLAANPRVLVDF